MCTYGVVAGYYKASPKNVVYTFSSAFDVRENKSLLLIAIDKERIQSIYYAVGTIHAYLQVHATHGRTV